MIRNDLADTVERLLKSDPCGWLFDSHHAMYGVVGHSWDGNCEIDLWITNRPYADLSVGAFGRRLGSGIRGWFQRRRIRKLIHAIPRTDQNDINAHNRAITQRQLADLKRYWSVDAMLDRALTEAVFARAGHGSPYRVH